MKIVLIFIKIYYGMLSVIAPKLAAKKAFKMFQKVRIKTIRQRERDFFNNAKRYTIKHSPEDILIYEYGDPSDECVILLHGWDSNAGSMSKINNTLVENNYRVISMNMPAHGESNTKYTNLHVVKEAVKTLLTELDLSAPINCITHSFGSGAMSYALSELDVKINKMVFLTSPNKMVHIFEEFKATISLSDKSYSLLCDMADNVLGEKIEELEVSEKLKQANYNKLLIIHDKNDKVLPYSNSVEICDQIPSTELISYADIGHYRMLWNDNVISDAISFLQSS